MESNTQRLIRKVDLCIKNVQVFNTIQCCFQKKDVALLGHVFYLIEDRLDIDSKEWLDGQQLYMIPGFVDIHMHVESSMTYPQAFYQKALKWGTTTCVADPHEMANVAGLQGVLDMLENARDTDLFFGIPSSVPSTCPELETTGGVIGLSEVSLLLDDPRMKCLGEVMNYADMKQSESKTRSLIALCHQKRPDIRIEGHCPKLSGEDLSYYLYCGVDADHTQQTPASILEKTAKGMFLEIQGKSLTKENVQTIVAHHLYENIALVTDDTMAHDLLSGHLNRIVAKAVKMGMPLEKAIYCATYTPARRMHFDDRGMIAPGKQADFILLKDFDSLTPLAVYHAGQKVQDRAAPLPSFHPSLYHSVHLPLFQCEDFCLDRVRAEAVLVNVIEIHPHTTFTSKVEQIVPVINGQIQWQEAGLALLAVFERYGKNGRYAFGLTKGSFQKRAAVASTWAHDHHNLMVMGTDPRYMMQAANTVIQAQGGFAVSDAAGTACVQLEIGGIISGQPIEILAEQLSQVELKLEQAGYQHDQPIMSFATLSLPVSPEIKMTDAGLIEVKTQTILPLVIKELNSNENHDS